MVSVLKKIPTRRLWLAAGTAEGGLSAAGRRAAGDARTEEVEVGHPSFQLGEAVIEVLGPPRDRLMLDGVNDTSLVLRVRHGDVTVLLTGDIEEAGEQALETTPVTVLKAPHHGSRTSSSDLLLDRARPQAVAIRWGVTTATAFPTARSWSATPPAGSRSSAPTWAARSRCRATDGRCAWPPSCPGRAASRRIPLP